jgi:hypothetical protein
MFFNENTTYIILFIFEEYVEQIAKGNVLKKLKIT